MLNYKTVSKLIICWLFITSAIITASFGQGRRVVTDFDNDWHFHLGDIPGAQNTNFKDTGWRNLNLPHDWSIEGDFSKDNPATPEGGALPGGIGWYRKTFQLPASSKDKYIFIDFDGIYQKSDVWLNGHHLGFRPNGYISFRYELTPFLNFDGPNTIAVKVDNSAQPNSRWYSGSGIYRNVWLVTINSPHSISYEGTYITTPKITKDFATIHVATFIDLAKVVRTLQLKTSIYDQTGKLVKSNISLVPPTDYYPGCTMQEDIKIAKPQLWSTTSPYMYKVVSEVLEDGELVDNYTTPFGIRYFNFDADKGFSLNGKPLKILGVCDHHDLGCLGAAINTRALERQLQILKNMGCNAKNRHDKQMTPHKKSNILKHLNHDEFSNLSYVYCNTKKVKVL